MPKYSLFGKKEAQEPPAQNTQAPTQAPGQDAPVLVLPRDDVGAPQPPQAFSHQQPAEQMVQMPEPPAPPPPSRGQDEYDGLLSWVARQSTDQIKKYFTEEGIKELLRRLAEDRKDPVAKLALALCGSSRQ